MAAEADRRYFFVVANYFLYGESIIFYFKHIVFVDAYFLPFARNHRFISFMLYVVGESRCSGHCHFRLRRLCCQSAAAVPPPAVRLFCWVHYHALPDRCVQVRCLKRDKR